MTWRSAGVLRLLGNWRFSSHGALAPSNLTGRTVLAVTIRDQWNVEFVCPRCGKAGKAILSEESQLVGDPGRRVDLLSPGFATIRAGPRSSDTRILCGSCGVSVWPSK